MSLGVILLIVVILILVGVLPTWPHARSWGYGPSGIVGVVVLIAYGMVADMIAAPFERRVLERPPASDQKTGSDPTWRVETSVGDHAMVAHRDAQARHHIQHPEHDPVQRGIPMQVAKEGHSDEGRQGDCAGRRGRPPWQGCCVW